MERPLYLGIDLGTTNSAASVFDGEQLTSVRNANGETLTPSVVRIDSRGAVSVGARARRYLQRDPDNTRGEFKRLMGSQNECRFAATQTSKKPEELAALVLGSLRTDAEAQLGIKPERAVVAVPALFELPQIKATSEAARLAGFSRIETIQEPVASALASGWNADEARGKWLVYDLGGGTFDASLLETQEGLLRVVGHDGDNFLGGRDFDLAMVDLLLQKLKDAGIVIDRANRAHQGAVQKLKAYAEEAKIELSRAATSSLLLDGIEVDGESIDGLEQVLTTEDLERVTAALIDRSLRVCQRLLRRHGVSQLDRIVLVGGPTLMPALRRRVQETLQAPFSTGLDPMLLVAQGAALFAATASLDARRASALSPTAKSGPRLWLQYPAMTPDTSPFVVGKALDDPSLIKAVRFVRRDGAWTSEWLPLETDATFSGMLSLKPKSASQFDVQVMLTEGGVEAGSPDQISVMHGVAIGEPPLARTIGVALASDSVSVYFERGTPLPMRKTVVHRTVQVVTPESEVALRIPVVQGDFSEAHLCRLVGVIEIPAAALKRALPLDSLIELTLEVDRGGALSVRAYLPDQDLVFDGVEQLVAPAPSIEQMTALVTQLQKRAAQLKRSGLRSDNPEPTLALAEFDSVLGMIRQDLEAAQGGDADATEKARRAIIDCDGLLGDLEAAAAWPEVTGTIYEEHAAALSAVTNYGTEIEQQALRLCMDQALRALRSRNNREIDRHVATMMRLRMSARMRHPDYWRGRLDACAGRASESSDPPRYQALESKARRADQKKDRTEVQRLVREMWELLPYDEETRKAGFDSGVH